MIVVALVGCRDVELPGPPPPPGPGTLQGTVVHAIAGSPRELPTSGARVQVLGTGLSTTTNASGRFLLAGLRQTRGTVLISATIEGVLRQRVFQLQALGVAEGRDIDMGEVALSRNAVVRGTVTLEGEGRTGLGGTTVFVPGGPWATYTADDGSFVLESLAQGALQIAAWRDGYQVDALDVTLGAGEDLTLAPIHLVPAPVGPAVVKAQVVNGAGQPATGANFRLRRFAADQNFPVNGAGALEASTTPGVYSGLVSREGSTSLALYNLFFPPGETDLGSLVMLDGARGDETLPDLGPWDGGALADAGSGDAGLSDAGMNDAGMNDAGMSDAGMSDAGMNDAGMSDAGMSDAGMSDAGMSDAGPNDAGTNDAGANDAGATDAGVTDAGIPPIAVVLGPAFGPPGTQVTISGMSSTGDFPLIYRWTQTGGTAVTLSANDSALAHSPRFTAPAAGTIVQFSLTVEDRVGNLSTPALLNVPIGVVPTARFVPDGGLLFGGQSVQLTSTSLDDAGVALVGFEWALGSGSVGTLLTDGGASATFSTPAMNFGDPDVLGQVTLRVTNAVGLRSGVTANNFIVRAANPNNWTIDAGLSQSISVGPTPPQVTLTGTVSTPGIMSPSYSVAWSCPPPVTLVGADTLTPSFIAPVIVGPLQQVVCQLTAVGQPPLNPPMQTALTAVLLRDTAPPTLIRSSIELTRMGRFGFIAWLSEPVTAAGSMNCAGLTGTGGWGERAIGNAAVIGKGYAAINEGMTCSNPIVTATDRATPTANTASNLPAGPANFVVQTQWSGPWVSTTTFTDPRPVIATLSQLPSEVQRLAGVTPGTPVGYALVAREGTNLVEFSGLDVTMRPTCSPSCALSSTSSPINLPTGALTGGERAFFSPRAELLVTAPTDGGIPVVARRDAIGAWSTSSVLTGWPGSWDLSLRTLRHDAMSQNLLMDTLDQNSGQFVTTSVVATGIAEAGVFATTQSYVIAAVGPSRNLFVRRQNGDSTWSTVTISSPVYSNIVALRAETTTAEVLVGIQDNLGFGIQRLDSTRPLSIAPPSVQGWDFASWADHEYVVYSVNGDIRFGTVPGSFWSGAGGGISDFGGPPRAGMPPYPVVLDNDPTCEAAWPQLEFVEDALVIIWQERCAPATQWNVVARVVR